MPKLRALTICLIVLLSLGLRLYRLESFPPAPYWEEVALGYDAFSIAETGRDHHGHWLPVVAFESFGDWKPGGYIYAAVPFIRLLGLRVAAIRLPAALAGVLIVIGVGVLTRRLQPKLRWLPVVSMAVTAISPWALIFSRAAWEVNLAAALILWGVISILPVIQHPTRKWWLMPTGVVLLVLSMYTYHAARIVAPLVGLGLVVTWVSNYLGNSWRRWPSELAKFGQQQAKVLVISGLLAVALLGPFILSLGSKTTSQRFAETSIFSNLDIIIESNQRIAELDGSPLARLMYHRYVLFGREIALNFLAHFNFNYLFLSGDLNGRHSIQFMGHLYHIEAVFLALGAYAFFKRWQKLHLLLLWWLIIGILPAAITFAAPHALRTLLTLPIWMYVIGLGIGEAVELLSAGINKLLSVVGIKLSARTMGLGIGLLFISLYLVELTMFWRFYTLIYPRLNAGDWQYGYAQVMAEVDQLKQAHPDQTIAVTRGYGRPAMYYWFYTRTNPTKVQAENVNAVKDQAEFLSFENLVFPRGVGEIPANAAFVALPSSLYPELLSTHPEAEVLSTVTDLQGTEIWKVVEVKLYAK